MKYVVTYEVEGEQRWEEQPSLEKAKLFVVGLIEGPSSVWGAKIAEISHAAGCVTNIVNVKRQEKGR